MRWMRWLVAGALAVTGAVVVPPPERAEAAGVRPAIWVEPSGNSIFRDSGRSPEARDDIRLDTAKNDYESAQIVLKSPAGFTVNAVEFTALRGATDTIPATELSYNPVEYQWLDKPSDKIYPVIRDAPGWFPDRLLNDRTVAVRPGETESLWVRVHVPATAAGGRYAGSVTVRTTAGDFVVPLVVNARNVVIPPANQSEFTNVMWTNFLGFTSWDHGKGDTIKLFYDYDRYSPQWWQLIDRWADTMKQYRQNSLQLPVINLLTDGGSKVDAAGKYTFNFGRFDEVVQRFLDKGVVHTLEGFVQAGPQTEGRNPDWPAYLIETTPKQTGSQVPDYIKYDTPAAENWYKQFYPALRQHLADKGWLSKFWTHVGDEPRADAGGAGWFEIADKIRSYWPDVKLADPTVFPMSPQVAEKADIVIPNLWIYSVDPKPFDAQRRGDKHKPLWLYNCQGPGGNYFNRFIDQPQWHQRQTMWFAYSRGVTGYLHWAYNNWQYNLSGEGSQGQKGDAWIVWPDKARGTLEMTTRYEALRDGMEDWEVLNKLGKTNPGLAREIARAMTPNGDKYSADLSYMQRVRAMLLDAAAGLPVVARDVAKGRPTTTGTNWVQVDLGRQAQLDMLHLNWGSVYGKQYRVLTSYNGTDWAEAGTRTLDEKDDLATPGGDDLVGLNAKARYVRLEVTESSGGTVQPPGLEIAGSLLLQQNLAGGKGYRKPAPSAPYPDTPSVKNPGSGTEATDGVLADEFGDQRSFGYSLTPGQHIEPAVEIDLGGMQTVGTVRVHAYEEFPAYRPDQVVVATSLDGVNYVTKGQLGAVNGASRNWYDVSFAPTPARWVRVTFIKTGSATATGLFVDDIEAYGAGRGTDEAPGGTAYPWVDAGRAGHEVIFQPSTTGSLGRWDWSAAGGVKRDDFGGGPIAGKSSGFSWYNQQHAVARTTSGKLGHWWWIESETAPHYAEWAGDIAGDPAAVVWSGQQHVFARSSTGDLTHWWWDPADGEVRSDRWTGASIVGTPSTFVTGNQLHVVARGTDNHLYHWWWGLDDTEPHLADWGGEALSDPTTFVWREQQHVLTQAADGQLFHWYWDPATGLNTDKWAGAPGKFVGAPAAFKIGDQQHVVARSPENTLYHWWWQEGSVVKWEDRGGEVYSDPVGFAFENQLQYFARSKTNTLAHWWQVPGDPSDGWHYNDWAGSVG
ncbi:glycoside hydrolase domain-containing protein [Kribbella sp. NPDC005582]|uniref:glycoside hydrolase domain-containing protein n=1 Tax=Kribbella sp. NPDC005582 TaxID=3156893 RepID=UPI0033BC2B64